MNSELMEIIDKAMKMKSESIAEVSSSTAISGSFYEVNCNFGAMKKLCPF